MHMWNETVYQHRLVQREGTVEGKASIGRDDDIPASGLPRIELIYQVPYLARSCELRHIPLRVEPEGN